MSIFTETMAALAQPEMSPLSAHITATADGLSAARAHLEQALGLIGNDYMQAMADRDSATTRIDELKTAALELSRLGAGLDGLIGEPVTPQPADPEDCDDCDDNVTDFPEAE